MGYKKSFNLVTLQLIIPLSTMTKAEYKNAYGIDLDDIDIEKVTLLQKDGSKEKYYVDEVKVTEDGVNILAGGKILSIGESNVSVTENAYSVENSKPIYCHPLECYDSTHSMIFTALILNNSPTPITNWTVLKAILKSFGSVGLLHASGSCATGDTVIIIAEIALKENKAYVIGYDLEGTFHTTSANAVEITDYAIQIVDGVNKIN